MITLKWIRESNAKVQKLMRVIKVGMIAAFAIVPFLSAYLNHTIAQWIWYPCATVTLFFIIWDWVRKNTCFEDPVWELTGKCGELLMMIVFPSVFVFNYYEIDYIWCWVIFAAIIIFVPWFFILLLNFDFSTNTRSKAEKKKAYINAVKHIVRYWMFDVLFCACFNGWTGWMYVLGIISVVTILWSATKTFLDGNEMFRWMLPFEFLIGVGLSVYLIYVVPSETLRGIVLTMVAAIYGGLFTLMGVAWTIKKGDADRQSELRRIEEERREEDRKKHIPFLKIANEILTADVARVISVKGIDFSQPEDIARLHNNTFYNVTINSFAVKNISQETIILKGITIYGVYYSFLRDAIVEVGGTCKVEITKNIPVSFAEIDETMALVVDDILGNRYSVACVETLIDDSSRYMICENESGEFMGLPYSCDVESVGLPILMDTTTESFTE